jgi:hypothetical protein
MPTIARPPRIGDYDPARDDLARAGARPDSVKLRLRVAIKRDALTRALAAGADPTSSPERALRARQLTSDRRRRQMIRTLRSTVAEARQPAMTRARVSIINRRAVLEAEDAIQAMVARLRSPDPIAVKGMAMAERILTDGVSSPLYNPAEPGTLRRLVLVSTAELGTQSIDWPIAA